MASICRSRRFVLGSVALAGALSLSACGGDEARSPATGGTTAAAAELPELNIEAFPQHTRAAVASLYATLKADPGDLKANSRVAMLAHAHGLWATAEALYRRSIGIEPGGFAWPYLSGVVQAQQGNTAAAMQSLRDALAISADYPAARLRLAQLLVQDGQTDQARRLFTALVEEYPDMPQAQLGYGQLLAASGQSDAAAQHLQKAAELAPIYGAAWYALSGLYQARGDTTRAAEYRARFEQNNNAAPPLDDPIVARVEDLRGSAQQAIIKAGRLSAQGRLREAADVFLSLLQTDPDNAVAHINLIGLLGSLDQFEQAQSHYQSGLALTPDDVKLHNNYGVLLLRAQRYADAATAFQRAIDADADYAPPYKYLGLCQQQLGDDDAALASFRSARLKDPLDLQAGYLLGTALLADESVDEAIEVLQSTLEPVSAKTPSYRRALALAWLAKGDTERAQTLLRDARFGASGYGQAALVATIDAELARLADAPSTVE